MFIICSSHATDEWYPDVAFAEHRKAVQYMIDTYRKMECDVRARPDSQHTNYFVWADSGFMMTLGVNQYTKQPELKMGHKSWGGVDEVPILRSSN